MNAIKFFKDLGYTVKIDSLLTIVFNRVIVDLFDFDYQIHKKYDPNNNYSLEYLLIKYYTGAIL